MKDAKGIVTSIAIITLVLFFAAYFYIGSRKGLGLDLEVVSGSPSPYAGKEEEPSPSSSPSQVTVYIAGEVVSPGVYVLPSDGRVEDVVNAAGGFLEEADQVNINLALPLTDAMHIIIYNKNETVDKNPISIQNSNDGNPAASGKININTADKEQLMTLKGIGPAISQNIMDYRKTYGGFQSIEEIKNVDRIGDKLYEGIKDYITVE